MQKWEYILIHGSPKEVQIQLPDGTFQRHKIGKGEHKTIASLLSACGKNGWEIIGFASTVGGMFSWQNSYWTTKRPVNE